MYSFRNTLQNEPVTGDLRSQWHGETDHTLVIRPNRSLPVPGIIALFVICAAVLLVISIGFAVMGAWLILPFAGLELVVVGATCWWMLRHHSDSEWLRFEQNQIRICKLNGSQRVDASFQRYWARIRLEASQPDGRQRLYIGSHGQYLELGRDLTDAKRAEYATRLNAFIASGRQIGGKESIREPGHH